MRIPNNKHIKFRCSSCKTELEAKNGNIINASTQNEKSEEVNYGMVFYPNKMRLMVTIVSVIAIFLISYVFYDSYNRERWSYEHIEEKPYTSLINKHLLRFENGEYTDILTLMRDSIYYNETMDDYNSSMFKVGYDCGEFKRTYEKMESYKIQELKNEYERCMFNKVVNAKEFEPIVNYKSEFPDSKYLDSIETIENGIWAALETKYKERSREKNISKNKSQFLLKLLNNARDQDDYTISVIMESDWDLKDWFDYTEAERGLVDTLVHYGNMMKGLDYPLPSESVPPVIKAKFSHINESSQNQIIKALQSRLDSIFMPNPFVLKLEKGKVDASKQTILIDYKIETLSEKYENGSYPSIYVHTEEVSSNANGSPNRHRFFKGYLLATSIEWNFKFSIPSSSKTIEIKSNSRPNSSFSGVNSQDGAYRVMMESSFYNYAEKIADDFGL